MSKYHNPTEVWSQSEATIIYRRTQNEDDDEVEYQVVEEKSIQESMGPGMKLSCFLALILFLVHIIYLQQKEPQKKGFVLVQTKYPSSLLSNQNADSDYGKAMGSNIKVYIPAQSFYLEAGEAYLAAQLAQRWRQNLFFQGTMLLELEQWILTNIKGNENCLIFWNDRISLSITLLAVLISKSGEGSLKVIVNQNHPKATIQAFKLTIRSLNLLQFITIQQIPDAYIVNQALSDNNLIISSDSLLHKGILQDILQLGDPFQEGQQELMTETFYKTYKQTKFIVIYQHQISQFEALLLSILKNNIKIIERGNKTYNENPFPHRPQAKFKHKFNLLLVDNSTSEDYHRSKPRTEESADFIAETNSYIKEKKQPILTSGLESPIKKLKVIQKPQYEIKYIRRMPQKEVILKANCSVPSEIDSIYLGDPIQTQIEGLKIIKKQDMALEQLADSTHLLKFILIYFNKESANVLYALQNQLIANFLAFSSKGYFLVSQSLNQLEWIQRSLQFNHFTSRIVKKMVPPEDPSIVIQQNEVGLAILELSFIGKWFQYQIQIPRNLDIMMRVKNNFNELELIETLFFKGVNIYIISPRKQNRFDLNCIRDFEFESFQPGKRYPPNSFYFISNSIIDIDPFDPITFQNSTIRRKIQILPYKCTSPFQTKREGYVSQQSMFLSNKYEKEVQIFIEDLSEVYTLHQQADEGLMEFIRSSLSSSQTVLIHPESTKNQFILMLILRKMKGYGSVYFLPLKYSQENLLRRNAENNDLGALQVEDEMSDSQEDIKTYYTVARPSFIMTTTSLLKKTLHLIKILPIDSVIAFRLEKQSNFNYELQQLSEQFKVYQIIHEYRSILPSGQCNNYYMRQQDGRSSDLSSDGWFLILR